MITAIIHNSLARSPTCHDALMSGLLRLTRAHCHDWFKVGRPHAYLVGFVVDPKTYVALPIRVGGVMNGPF